MPRFSLWVVLTATILTFAALYAPQPLLPLMSETFAISRPHAATLITWSFFPMCIAPIFVGLLMQVVAPRWLLAWGLLLLGLTEFAFFSTETFWGLQVIRLGQGVLVAVLLPAILTTIAATAEAQHLRRVMAYYVATAVLGGLAGRIVAGEVNLLFGWRPFFLGIGIVLVISAAFAFRLPPEKVKLHRSIQYGRLLEILKQPVYRRLYGTTFAAFLVLTALLNFAPFRLEQLDATVSTSTIALSYSGFLLGMLTSLLSGWLVRLLGSELRAVALGLVLLGAAILVAQGTTVTAVTLSIATAAVGFFLSHAVLAGYLNARAGDDASTVNGLYLAIYYFGGTIGSYLPGLVYVRFGWTAFVMVLLLIATLGLGLTLRCMPASTPATSKG